MSHLSNLTIADIAVIIIIITTTTTAATATVNIDRYILIAAGLVAVARVAEEVGGVVQDVRAECYGLGRVYRKS